MSVKPKASFVCPTYNCAGYIAETINSIISQTVKEWELIVVDDGSTDTTPLLMKYFRAQDDRIKYLRFNENKGTVHARNAGNAVAESDLILVIDHDDLCSKDRLATTLAHFKKYPDTEIFHAGWYEVNVRREPISDRYKPINITKKKLAPFCHSTCAYPARIADEYPYHEYVADEGEQTIHKTDDLCALEDWTGAGLKFRKSNKILCAVRRLPRGQMQAIRVAKGLPPSWRQ